MLNRNIRKIAVIVLITAILVCLAIGGIDNGRELCIFKKIFAIPCAGCGLSRGIYHIVHFDFTAALQCNILTFPLFFAAIAVVIWNIYDLTSCKDTFFEFNSKLKFRWWYFAIGLVVMAISWSYNIYSGM